MTTSSKRPPLRELLTLFQSTVAREGTTTGAGAATGDSIIDAGLIGAGANSFVSMLMIVYPGEFNNVDSMDITGFNNATGEVTLNRAYKLVAAAIPAGVRYKIVTFRFVPAEVAALTTLVNSLIGAQIVFTGVTDGGGDVGGRDLFDATLATEPSYVGDTVIILDGAAAGASRAITDQDVFAGGLRFANPITDIAQVPIPIVVGVNFVIVAKSSPDHGLGHRAIMPGIGAFMMGQVYHVGAGSTTSINVPSLAGLPVDLFNAGFSMVVLRAGGVVPETEVRDITNYTVEGVFTCAAFSAVVEDGDVVAVYYTSTSVDPIFHEQVDAVINENVAAAEIFVVTLNVAATSYILRDLRIKSADPTIANTITVRLYTLINDVETNVDSFIITNANFATYFSLMDMFGVPHVAGDSIRVSVQGSAAGPYAVTGQYSHGRTNA